MTLFRLTRLPQKCCGQTTQHFCCLRATSLGFLEFFCAISRLQFEFFRAPRLVCFDFRFSTPPFPLPRFVNTERVLFLLKSRDEIRIQNTRCVISIKSCSLKMMTKLQWRGVLMELKIKMRY